MTNHDAGLVSEPRSIARERQTGTESAYGQWLQEFTQETCKENA